MEQSILQELRGRSGFLYRLNSPILVNMTVGIAY